MKIPFGYDEINEVYGNPDFDGDMRPDVEFLLQKMVVQPAPFPMRCSWNLNLFITKLYAHVLAVDLMAEALEEILILMGPEELRAKGWDICGGIYSFRPKTSGKKLTTHAWGIAIDYCPHLGPYGQMGISYPKELSEPFLNRGCIQLKNDMMHFQLCDGY